MASYIYLFEYFNKQEFASDYFKYTAYPDREIMDTSHPFCKEHAGKVYHISDINSWTSSSSDGGWIPTSNFFQQFNGQTGTGPHYGGGFSNQCKNQLYECRHKLVQWKPKSYPAQYGAHFVKMEMLSEDKREVQGLVLKSNQMIFRTDVDGTGNPGYVYFSRATVRQLRDKYGYNRSISYMHRDDCTGQAILMESWIVENDAMNETQWFVKYKIIGDKLWQMIKSKTVKGFSIESIFVHH